MGIKNEELRIKNFELVKSFHAEFIILNSSFFILNS